MNTGVDYVGIAGLVTAVLGGTALVIGAFRGQRKAENEKPKPSPAPIPIEAVPLPDARSPEDVLSFMAILQQDNVSLREQQRDDHAWRVKAEHTIEELTSEVVAMKSERTRFDGALGRYLSLLFREWGKSDRPPLPSGDDLIVLRDVIPRA